MGDLQKFEKLVEKKKWKALEKSVKAGKHEERVDLAKALGNSRDEEPYIMLTVLLTSPEKDIQLAAIESLGKTGRQTAVSYLGYTRDHTEDKEIIEAVNAACRKLRESK